MIKRIMSTILAGAMIFTMSTTAFASRNKNQDWIPPGIAKKAFDDLDKFPWAQKAIEKMRLKGLVKGKSESKFHPQSPVTKLETIIMALRIMDWEEEAANKFTLPKKYKGSEVGEWAKGYVSVAYEKGILDDVDMMYFKPNEPAKRHEVAKYVIRAIGYEDEAQDHMDQKLSFKDAPAIPQGSVGYVYLVHDMKLMIGNDGKFNPMGTLTRAEMAVLFDRLDDKVDNDVDEDQYQGEIHRISENKITLKINEELKSFNVSNQVVVYDQDDAISYAKLKAGQSVLIQLEEDEVVYIELMDEKEDPDKIISKYTGEVTDILEGSPAKLTVQIERMQIIFEVNNNAIVTFKKEKGSFDEIEIGDTVRITVDNKNRAREIYVNRERTTIDEVKGTITDIDLSGTYHLFIDDKSYSLSKEAKVTILDSNASLKELKIGDEVLCLLSDNIITKVTVKETYDTVSVQIKEINSTFIIITENEEDATYKLARNLVVTIDGENSKYNKLEAGMEVELQIRNDLVYQIDAKNQKLRLSATITEITQVEKGYILTLSLDKTKKEYLIADDVKISIGDEDNKEIQDLKINQEGTFEVENNLIQKIIIEE